MKVNKIAKISTALLCGATIVMTSCIKETLPMGSTVTEDQREESPFAGKSIISAVSTSLIVNRTGSVSGEHFDFGYAGIFGATDRLAGEVFPVSGNMPGGNQYYDRWQGYLYPANINGLSATGYCVGFFWNNYYTFIKEANSAILAAGDNEDLKEVRGMAKAFRALFYLDMARLYEALPAKAPNRTAYESEVLEVEGLTVPIVTELTTEDEARNNPRADRETMFEFIFSDLDEAEECLKDFTQTSINLPSLAVVYGLKARAYLWLGGFSENYDKIPTGNDAYKKAAEYARKAIEASGCTIMTESSWTSVSGGFNKKDASWLWGMVQSADTVINNLLSWSAHMSPEAMYGYGNGSQPGISVFSFNRIPVSDFRKKVFVDGDRSYSRIQPYTTLTKEDFEGTSEDSNSPIAPYTSFKFHTNSGEKTNFTVANVTSIPMMRVEEMYLIEAEATAHYDEGTARNLLTTFMSYRNKRYTISAVADIVEEIIFQKRIEFWGEGIVFYDMKRLNMSMHNGDEGTNAPSMAQFSTDGRAPWWNCVIPLSATTRNTGIVNNPNPLQTVRSVSSVDTAISDKPFNIQ